MKSKIQKKIILIILFFIVGVFFFLSAETKIIFSASTSDDKTLKEQDIAVIFKQKILRYMGKNSQFTTDWRIFTEKEDQNYAWAIQIFQEELEDDLLIYGIGFYFSNGCFIVKFGNKPFISTLNRDDNNSQPINAATLDYITLELKVCASKSIEVWSDHGNSVNSEPDNWKPMDFYLFD